MPAITLGWLHLVILAAAVQGVLLSAALVSQRRNPIANRLLATAMFAFSVYLATAVYHAAGLVPVFPHFFGAAYPLPLLFGPLIFLYAVTAADRTRRLRWWDAWHFIPFAAVVGVGLPIYLMSGPEKVAFFEEITRGTRPAFLAVVDPVKFVVGVSYATATILFLRRHRARVKDNYSSLDRVNLRWLLRLAVAAAAIWALATSFQVMEVIDHPLLLQADDAVSLAVAVLVYGIGYMALRQPEIFDFAARDRPSVKPEPGAAGPPSDPPVDAPSQAAPAPRYERSGLTEEEASALRDGLATVMDSERAFRDSGLTLADLSARLRSTPHKVSEVLNAQLNQTFYDFVNGYRVRDVQRRMADERSSHLTILSLALDAGFASKSTFNEVFKKYTGRTPSAYRRAARS